MSFRQYGHWWCREGYAPCLAIRRGLYRPEATAEEIRICEERERRQEMKRGEELERARRRTHRLNK